ncbi:NUMOD4 domain-containing protein [Paenibacillus chitinolyticus]|uniref:NUMOD4 domain-containing protein n=1 Tax=Paenibacillus chitinolyticus TaxID=79263 RepID=UPI002DBA43CD|nr:NUMOD4 domain-containing protein [Paenibacillus chitinolyticus]MEC0245652.1 NUMOD4 domain-containing protein [Paenibacillus chitinolyticus]
MDNEISADIIGYEGLYRITESGRIYSVRRKKFMSRNNDQYGFKYVHLSKKGERKLYLTLELWEQAFNHLQEGYYKGMH